MTFEVTNFNYEIRRMKEKHKHFEDHYFLLVSIVFVQLSEGKMVGHLSGLHNELCRVNNTVSLSCIFKFQFATPCQMYDESKLR